MIDQPKPAGDGDLVSLKWAGMCMREIRHSPLEATVTVDNSKEGRDALRKAMGEYFHTPMEIFPEMGSAPKYRFRLLGSLVTPLVPSFITVWPKYLDDRLKAITERKFAHADTQFRRLIEEMTKVFLYNLALYIFWKRLFQLAAVAAEVYLATSFSVSSGWTRSLAALLPMGWGDWAGAFALFLVLSLVTLAIFAAANEYVFRRVYHQALKNSADVVCRKLIRRMSSLYDLYKDYKSQADTLLHNGEYVSDDKIKETDESLSSFQGFFYVQVLLWLAKRVEYLELHLFHEMHSAQRKQAELDFIGFLVAFVIFCSSLVILNNGVVSDDGLLARGLFVCSIASVVIVTWSSYFFSRWNSGQRILENYLSTKTDDWMTFNRFKLDETLGARYQRALARIKHFDEERNPWRSVTTPAAPSEIRSE